MFLKEDYVPATRYDPEGCEGTSIEDLPIELRRMDGGSSSSNVFDTEESRPLLDLSWSQRSISLDDIQSQSPQSTPVGTPTSLTRSQSTIIAADGHKIKTVAAEVTRETEMLKPKLVKQKKSICEEEFGLEKDEERDKPTDMKNLETEMPMFMVKKQKSMNEDILSGRMEDKKRIRENIRKQISLNDDIIR